MLERHRLLARVEIRRDGAQHRLVNRGVETDRDARLHGRADQHVGPALRCGPRVVRRVAIEAVEILLEHELAVPRDQHAVDLGGADILLRHVDQLLDELLDCCLIDAFLFERRYRPSIVEPHWRNVAVPLRWIAARMEGTAPALVAGEVEAAPGQGQAEPARFRIERATGDDPCFCLTEGRTDQPDGVAILLDPRRADKHALVALRVTHVSRIAAVGDTRDRQVVGHVICAWQNLSSPASVAVRAKNERRRIARAAFDRRGLDPLAVDLTADELATKAALAVWKVEAELPALLLYRHGKARNIGDNAVPAPEYHQPPAHVGAKARAPDPEAFEVRRGRGPGRHGGGDQKGGAHKPESRTHRHSP